MFSFDQLSGEKLCTNKTLFCLDYEFFIMYGVLPQAKYLLSSMYGFLLSGTGTAQSVCLAPLLLTIRSVILILHFQNYSSVIAISLFRTSSSTASVQTAQSIEVIRRNTLSYLQRLSNDQQTYPFQYNYAVSIFSRRYLQALVQRK